MHPKINMVAGTARPNCHRRRRVSALVTMRGRLTRTGTWVKAPRALAAWKEGRSCSSRTTLPPASPSPATRPMRRSLLRFGSTGFFPGNAASKRRNCSPF